MNAHPGLLSKAEEIKDLADALRAEKMMAFDTEFIRESTFFPIVEVIQIATEHHSWLIDAQAFKKNHKANDPHSFDTGFKPLLEIFSDPKILKIAHASQGDQECLYTSFGVVAKPVFDTAVGASLCGFGDGIGLGKLLKLVLDVNLTKGHARTNWSVRPLPQQLADYAHADVQHLVQLATVLLAQLDEAGRKNWALELSSKWEDVTLYQTNVEEMAQKLGRGKRLDTRSYGALLQMVKWREDRIRQLNLPRRWVADDQVLIDLAMVRPLDMAHLSSFRGLNKGELKNSGETILALLRECETETSVEVPHLPRPLVPTQQESQVIDLLRCFVGLLADQHKIAVKHLLTTPKLLKLIRSSVEKPEDLIKTEILSEEATRLIGDELIALVRGKRGLAIKNKQIDVLKLV